MQERGFYDHPEGHMHLLSRIHSCSSAVNHKERVNITAITLHQYKISLAAVMANVSDG